VGRKKLQTPYDDLSPDQLLQLEDLVKNFISNVKVANIEPLETMLQMMGHGSHVSDSKSFRERPLQNEDGDSNTRRGDRCSD
jgi:hypothetical protein